MCRGNHLSPPTDGAHDRQEEKEQGG